MSLVHSVRCLTLNYSKRAISYHRMRHSMSAIANTFANQCHTSAQLSALRFLQMQTHLPFADLTTIETVGKLRHRARKRSSDPKLMLTDQQLDQLMPFSELKAEVNHVMEKFKYKLNSNSTLRSDLSSIQSATIDCQRAVDELQDILSSFCGYVKEVDVSEDNIVEYSELTKDIVNEKLRSFIEMKVTLCRQLLENKINELLR